MHSKPSPQQVNEAGQRLAQQFRSTGPIALTQLLIKRADRLLTERCHLTYSQFKVLALLATHHKASQQDVAKLLELTPAAVSRLSETLTKKNFITRQVNEENRREHVLGLSTLGRQQLSTAIQLLKDLERELYSQVKSSDLEVFDRVIQELLDLVTKAE